MAFASSFGQTYFIGIFGPSIQMEFGLSHTTWGTIYMVGTLVSAASLPWTGRQIDRLDLKRYAVLVCLLLIVACGFMAIINGPVALVLAIFLLRQSGQGLSSHVAVTSMVRYFDSSRGRAIAIATLGFAAGEAFLPFIAVLAIAAVGWRWSYGGVAVLLCVGLIPTVLWLLKGHDKRHRLHLERHAQPTQHGGSLVRSWTRREVLRDTRFYLLLPGLLAPSIVLTAMFFHHLNLADAKGWTHAWITGNYVVYAAATTFTSLASGPLIDRLGAVRLVPFMLAPLAVGMIVVGVFDSGWAVWPYFILAGINVGIAHTAVSAMWAEMYGITHLGAIKSLVAALQVFGSALGPVTMGSLMDLGVSIENVCLLFVGMVVVGAILIRVALPGRSIPR
ncbi:MAG: MFS transporter [Gammaproteobacteria bacterium]|nr:MFS transporter [Gammaproteobacteria bacterium]MDH3464843.1 MFS transporter [Gammaproteobacteria bacterium]